MRAYLAAVAVCLLGACGAARSAIAPSPCSGFRNARGPYATLRAPFTALPSAVQFEAERDVISLGEVPRVIVRAGNAGIGRFNETSEFTVTNPDGSKNDGPCDPAREPGTSAGFAALNFKCHPFTQLGVYTIRFEPARSGLTGDPVELRLRVVKAAPASDFWPLILKLSHDERVRLAKLALRAAAHDDSVAAAYAAAPPVPEEFSSDDQPPAWEGQGWDEFRAPR
jgi:hypothetical protein